MYFISCPIKAESEVSKRVRSLSSEGGVNGCVIFYAHGWEQEKKESITVNFIGNLCGSRTSGMILAVTN